MKERNPGIRLKAMDSSYQRQATSSIPPQRTGATVAGPIPPTLKNRYAMVLRSPHVAAKSREQSGTTHKVFDCCIPEPTQETVDALMKPDPGRCGCGDQGI